MVRVRNAGDVKRYGFTPPARALEGVTGSCYNAVNQPVQLFLHIFQASQDIDITRGSIGILQIPDFLDPKCKTEERHEFVELVYQNMTAK